jgi:hypothetical protein
MLNWQLAIRNPMESVQTYKETSDIKYFRRFGLNRPHRFRINKVKNCVFSTLHPGGLKIPAQESDNFTLFLFVEAGGAARWGVGHGGGGAPHCCCLISGQFYLEFLHNREVQHINVCFCLGEKGFHASHFFSFDEIEIPLLSIISTNNFFGSRN